MERNGRIIELDGLRGLAALSVVAEHYVGRVSHGLPWLQWGWVGVVLFFVLSGYLVGGMLIDERESPHFFASFYVRRSMRIFPIYYIVLFVTFVFSYEFHIRAWAGPYFNPLAYVFYVQNVFDVTRGMDGDAFVPLWSLAIEEQFYLLVPLIVYLTPPRHFPKLVLVGVASAPALRFLFPSSLGAAVLLPCRWDAVLLGMLVAIAQRDTRWRLVMDCIGNYKVAASGCLLLVAVLALVTRDLRLQRCCLLLSVALSGTLYLLLLISGAVQARTLRSDSLCYLGRISYCLYLVHQPVACMLSWLILGCRPDVETPAQVTVTIAAFATSLAIASLSWRWFEAPLIAAARRWTYQRSLTPMPS